MNLHKVDQLCTLRCVNSMVDRSMVVRPPSNDPGAHSFWSGVGADHEFRAQRPWVAVFRQCGSFFLFLRTATGVICRRASSCAGVRLLTVGPGLPSRANPSDACVGPSCAGVRLLTVGPGLPSRANPSDACVGPPDRGGGGYGLQAEHRYGRRGEAQVR
jgi:hypothetical protein